ncbi:MAG: flavodoxin family protein [Firmicutes bacterium]|nr:flavodoxin family protein [Bacillota bacterium]
MKILAFFGGARKNGNTLAMLNYLLDQLEGEKEIINCYSLNVSPCTDCRYCFKHRACSIKDEMVDIYRKVDEADIIIFAAPTYFFGIPGKMKVMIDRFQMYWSGVKRGDLPEKFTKKGAYLMSGGGPLFDTQFTGGGLELSEALVVTNTKKVGAVLMDDADIVTNLAQRPEIKEKILEIANLLK